MNKIFTIIISFIFILLSQTIVQAQQNSQRQQIADLQKRFLAKITKEEMQVLFEGVNPAMLNAAAENSDLRKRTIESLKDLFAIASQAVKEGFADNPDALKELKNIRSEVIAAEYDRELNKGKPASNLPFSQISEERVREFYAKPENNTEFGEFLKHKLKQAQESGIVAPDYKLTEEQTAQVREYFAKTRVYENEAGEKVASLGAAFNRRVEMQVKMQQAQYLAQLYHKKVLAAKSVVTDAAMQKFLAENPLLDPKILRAKATWIFLRVKAGEDFAKLAAEFSEDPGSKDKGGLFENVKKGAFVADFEKAALSLEPGQIYPELLETKFGYHIIKLEGKQVAKDADGKEIETYTARHILFSTIIKDPQNAFITMTLEEKVKAETEKKLIAEIRTANPIEIEDFEFPKLIEDDLSDAKIFPPAIKAYLDKTYEGWKISASKEGCGTESNIGIVTGSFNGDERPDYAVKFTQGEKGYIIAFIAKKPNYKAFVLRDDYTADQADFLSLGITKKGETFVSEEKSIVLKRDAPGAFSCESDAPGAYLYRHGKFKTL